jgi:predicted deacylase
VPVVNEPAFARGARTADDGMDLARVCPGRADGSVTEQIADALSHLIRDADYFIDLHTGGLVLEIVPLAGYMLHPDAPVLEVQRRMARAFNLPLVWGTTARLDGRSLSVARDANVPAIYVEHGGGGPCNPAKVDDLVAGCFGVMAELGMIDRAPSISRVRHIVEDDRDKSGHLQINHPSPRDGFFEPAVRLGQIVSTGDTIGTVTNVLGDDVTTVRASSSGMILMLRAFRSVKRRDPLAAIIAVEET